MGLHFFVFLLCARYLFVTKSWICCKNGNRTIDQESFVNAYTSRSLYFYDLYYMFVPGHYLWAVNFLERLIILNACFACTRDTHSSPKNVLFFVCVSVNTYVCMCLYMCVSVCKHACVCGSDIGMQADILI